MPSPQHKTLIRAQDFAWLLFVVVLIVTSPERNYDAMILLPIIGGFQIIEPRLTVFSSRRGQIVSIALKLIFSFLLVGWTHAIYSYYYQIFLIPVVSAATTFELAGVIIVVLLAGLEYFSFLLPVFYDYTRYEFPDDQAGLMGLRVAFFAIVAFLVYEQARAKRLEMIRTQEANKNLHEAQISLRRSERLAALGQLTAGLAHELRNPLGTIKASAEMLTKAAVSEDGAVRLELAGYIASEVNRMNGLIGSFLNFAKPLQLNSTLSDMDTVLESAIHQHDDLAKERQVSVTFHHAAGPCTMRFDVELLRVAVTNLVQNAIQASAPGQTVEVTREQDAGKVKIAVADHGAGIAPQNLESIFNPFFTTKANGVGLGLAIVAKIVDEHLGRIQVKSEQGKGAVFEIVLPRLDA